MRITWIRCCLVILYIVDQVVPRDHWLIKSANQIMAKYAFSQETNSFQPKPFIFTIDI